VPVPRGRRRRHSTPTWIRLPVSGEKGIARSHKSPRWTRHGAATGPSEEGARPQASGRQAPGEVRAEGGRRSRLRRLAPESLNGSNKQPHICPY
jgi:hypothetical protein